LGFESILVVSLKVFFHAYIDFNGFLRWFWKRYKDFPKTSYLHTCIDSPTINMLYQSGIFVTADEPTLIHHCHPNSVVNIRAHSWHYTSCNLGQIVMTCIQSYGIRQSSFTSLKSCVPPFLLPIHWFLKC
jgi:hypothetical protein